MNERPPAMSDNLRRPASYAAEQWLVRRESGVDIEADPAFARWLSADADNMKAWASTAALWDRIGEDVDDPLLQAMRLEAMTARPPPPFRWNLVAAGVAAIAVAGVLGWTLGLNRAPPPGSDPWVAADASATFSNGRAAPRTTVLPDGSRLTLDADSAVAVAYEGPRRGVRLLKGRAFFDVVHDAARPFRVEAGDGRISDLGTAFDVRLTGASLSVTVASGSVSVRPAKAARETLVAAGQAFDVGPQGTGLVAAADPDALSWRDGILTFRDTPLKDAVRQINRYGGASVVVSGVDAMRVSGQFRPGDARRFAQALAEIYPLEVRDRADGVVEIRGKTAR